MARTIDWTLEIDWDFNGSYTDESSRLISASGDSRLTPPGESVLASRGIVSNMNLTLDNSDGRYSALNSSSPLYSLIQNGGGYHVPVKLSVSINGGSNYYEIFRGVTKMPDENGLTMREANTISITCRSEEEKILSKRVSTTISDFATWHINEYDEEQLIAALLADAGLTDGTDFVSQSYGGTATLDPGLFIIPWVWQDDESPIEDCWDLAAACGGRFYAGPDGRYYYENAQNWLLNSATSTETLTESDYAGPLQAGYDDVNLYKSVIVQAQPRRLGEIEVVWQPDEIIVVPGNSTRTVQAKLRQPIYTLNEVTYDAVTAGGQDVSASITVNATPYAQRVDLEIINAHATKSIRLRNLSILGRPVYGEPSISEEAISTDGFWDDREGRTRNVNGNPLIQTRAHAKFVAELLRDAQETPLLNIRVRGVPGDPTRTLGSRITFNDASVMSGPIDAYLTSIRWQLSANAGFKQDLEAVESDRMHPYDADDYFVIGTSTWGGSDRIYY